MEQSLVMDGTFSHFVEINLWNSLSLEANSCSTSHYGSHWLDIVFTCGICPEPQVYFLHPYIWFL